MHGRKSNDHHLIEAGPKCLANTDLKKYNPEIHPYIVHTLAQLSYNQDQMAQMFGISTRKFKMWLKEHDELRIQWRFGAENPLKLVESSLYRLTQTHTLSSTEITYDADGNVKQKKVTIKEVDPDISAVFRYLCAKNWAEWSGAKEGGNQTCNIVIAKEDSRL
jgi:hypothetical protein